MYRMSSKFRSLFQNFMHDNQNGITQSFANYFLTPKICVLSYTSALFSFFFFLRRPSHGASPRRALSTPSHTQKSYTLPLFNMTVRPHTAVTGRGHFLVKLFLADGMAVVDQSPGPHVHLTSHPRIFFLLPYPKDCVWRSSVDNTATLRARLVEAIGSVAKGMLIRTSAELDRCLHMISSIRSSVLRRTKAYVKVVSYGTVSKRLHICVFG